MDLDSVDTGFLQQDSRAGISQIKPNEFRALTAVITDAVARFQYERTQLMDFAFDVMGIHD